MNNNMKCPVCGFSTNLSISNKCVRCGASLSCSKGCSGNCLKCAMQHNQKPERIEKRNKY